MPFILKKAARKKSRFYRNILDANETEQLRVAQKELKIKANKMKIKKQKRIRQHQNATFPFPVKSWCNNSPNSKTSHTKQKKGMTEL